MTLDSCLLLRRCRSCIRHPQALYLAAKPPHQMNIKLKTVCLDLLTLGHSCNISRLPSSAAHEWTSIAKPLATAWKLSWPPNGPQRDERGIRNQRADRQNTWRELFVLETTRPFDQLFLFFLPFADFFFFFHRARQATTMNSSILHRCRSR